MGEDEEDVGADDGGCNGTEEAEGEEEVGDGEGGGEGEREWEEEDGDEDEIGDAYGDEKSGSLLRFALVFLALLADAVRLAAAGEADVIVVTVVRVAAEAGVGDRDGLLGVDTKAGAKSKTAWKAPLSMDSKS